MNLRKNKQVKNMNLLTIASFLLAVGILLIGCYRMPTDDDYSVVPQTNHPDVTREKQTTAMPSVEY